MPVKYLVATEEQEALSTFNVMHEYVYTSVVTGNSQTQMVMCTKLHMTGGKLSISSLNPLKPITLTMVFNQEKTKHCSFLDSALQVCAES